MKKVWAGILLAILIIMVVVFFKHNDPVTKPTQTLNPSSSSTSESWIKPPKNSQASQIAQDLKRRYGASIGSVVTQARLLSELDRLQSLQPIGGSALFEEAVSLAFASRAPQILALIDLLIEYEDWVDENSAILNRLDAAARLAKLWEKRYELFGDDADLLWADSALGGDAKQVQIQAEMDRLSQIKDQSAGSIADQLLKKVDEVYGGSTAAALLTPNDLGQAVFALDSVQANLAGLDAKSRAREIEQLRRQAGYSEDAIAKLAARDQSNQQKWDTGYQYQAAKQQLAEQYTGARYEQQLSILQFETFGSLAKAIAAEERSGFYRYDRPRQYGVN